MTMTMSSPWTEREGRGRERVKEGGRKREEERERGRVKEREGRNEGVGHINTVLTQAHIV